MCTYSQSQLFTEILPPTKAGGRELQEPTHSLENKGGDHEEKHPKTKNNYQDDDEDENEILLVGLLNLINND